MTCSGQVGRDAEFGAPTRSSGLRSRTAGRVKDDSALDLTTKMMLTFSSKSSLSVADSICFLCR